VESKPAGRLEDFVTTKEAFTPEAWTLVLEGPPTAGMIVITSSGGGMFKETWAMSKAYAEARRQHGESELLDEIVATKPKTDHTHARSREEWREHGLGLLRQVVTLLTEKATPEELDDYRRFVLAIAHKVAEAHREKGELVSPAETEALEQIETALGASAS
jgi:hypothetical protein